MIEQFLWRYERALKNLALILGVVSTFAVVMNWYPINIYLSLPFCLIWLAMGWLHGERQLKWLNLMFTAFYLYGIWRYISLES